MCFHYLHSSNLCIVLLIDSGIDFPWTFGDVVGTVLKIDISFDSFFIYGDIAGNIFIFQSITCRALSQLVFDRESKWTGGMTFAAIHMYNVQPSQF